MPSKLDRAIAAADVHRIRELLPADPRDAANPDQLAFIWAHAAMLEIGSAGMSILFDRFTRPELKRLASALLVVGATDVSKDFEALDALFAGARAKGMSRLDASEWLAGTPRARAIDRKHAAHEARLEAALLDFAGRRTEALEARRPISASTKRRPSS